MLSLQISVLLLFGDYSSVKEHTWSFLIWRFEEEEVTVLRDESTSPEGKQRVRKGVDLLQIKRTLQTTTSETHGERSFVLVGWSKNIIQQNYLPLSVDELLTRVFNDATFERRLILKRRILLRSGLGDCFSMRKKRKMNRVLN